MTTLASRDLRGIAFWLMGDLSISLPRGLLWILMVRLLCRGGRHFHHRLRSERPARRRARGHASRRGRHPRQAGRLRLRIGAHRPGRFRQRRHRLRRACLCRTSCACSSAPTIACSFPPRRSAEPSPSSLADTLARTIIAPTELPVGAMTAMAGAPVFIYLLRRRLA